MDKKVHKNIFNFKNKLKSAYNKRLLKFNILLKS